MGNDKRNKREREHPEGRLRDAVVRGLDRIDRGAWVDRLSPAHGFSDDDRRRITEFLAGITRKRRWLDFLIDAFAKRPKAIESGIRNILRLAVYEIVEQDRAGHSVVFASVEQTKRHSGRGADRFVNGLLRSLLRSIDQLPQPASGDPASDLAIRHSHPDWMARRWIERYGVDAAEQLMAYNNARPVHSIRVNTLKTNVEDFTTLLDGINVTWSPSPYLPEFIRITQLQPVIGAGLLANGMAAVQDESAGLVGRALAPQPEEFIIDACAAPCGKLIHAGLMMNNRGRLLGVDANEKRLTAGLSTARRHGVSIAEVRAGDFRMLHPDDIGGQADAVLVDAPCSGLGVLARRADLRWSRGEESIEELTQLQDGLLDAAARFVKPGGRLVYATCTISPEENGLRVADFLDRHPEFSEVAIEGLPSVTDAEGRLETLPHVHGIDGAFAARFVRVGE